MTLIERHEQLLELAKLHASCVAGAGRVAVLGGPVGSGKTELLRAFAEQVTEAGGQYVAAPGLRTERALAFGLVDRLFKAAGPAVAGDREMTRLIEDGALAAALHGDDAESVEPAIAPILEGLVRSLLARADEAPLVLGIDDVQHADIPSLLFLSHLARRVGAARVLLLVVECTLAHPSHPLLAAELRRAPVGALIRIAPLTRRGVAQLLRDQLDGGRADRLAGPVHAMTGGNLRLIHGLMQDLRTGASADAAEPVAGKAFDQAVAACQHGSDPTMRRVARAMAILDQPASPTTIGRLLGVPTDMVSRAVGELERAGIIASGRFRHPRVSAAMLDDMGPERRASAHERAARVLRREGASATAVARQVAAADRIGEPWMVPLMQEAAEQLLAEGDTERALGYLRLALREGGPEHDLRVKAMLLRATWRVDPSSAEPYLDELTGAALEGRLGDVDAVQVARYLLWYGRAEEVRGILAQVRDGTQPQLDAEVDLGEAHLLTGYLCPRPATEPAGEPPATERAAQATVSSTTQAVAALWSVLRDGTSAETVRSATQVLQRTPLDDATLPSIITALSTLAFADELDTAMSWCDRLLEMAALMQAPTWRALLTTVRADILFRRGDLHGAEREARSALTLIPSKSWGVLVGAPLGILLRAATELGNHQVALTHLSIPVPPEMAHTPMELYYRYARGRFYLATGRYESALADFDACRDTMVRWRMDLPGVAPWRVSAAEAHLRLRRRDRARELIEDQLARLGPGHDRVRALSLRVLAALSDVRDRPALLDEATRLLKACGDRLELSYAFADLGDALYATGEGRRAEMVSRTAQQIGAEYRVPALHTGGSTADAGRREAAAQATEVRPTDRLSYAERRVAALAALGYSNRQIAGELHLTISTVEQHLTRIYRKLRVSRRTDLPPELHLEAGEIA